MLPIEIAIILAALWLLVDLLPLAKWLAVRKVAIDPRFTREMTSESAQFASAERKLLTALRDRTFKRYKWTYSLAFFVVVTLGCAKLIGSVRDRGYTELREDVYEHLDADSASPSEDSIATAEITVKNDSSSDVFLDSFDCTVRKLELNLGLTFTDSRFRLGLNGARLTRGGSGQSLPCTPERLMHSSTSMTTRCADVEWTLSYTINSHPRQIENKSYRYILQVRHTRWEEVALDASVDPCKEY